MFKNTTSKFEFYKGRIWKKERTSKEERIWRERIWRISSEEGTHMIRKWNIERRRNSHGKNMERRKASCCHHRLDCQSSDPEYQNLETGSRASS